MDEVFGGAVAAGADTESSKPTKPGAATDLAGMIERAVAREPQDRVRCVRVFGDRYRCNWWAPEAAAANASPMAAWAWTATHRVRLSRFIVARLDGEQLVMNVVVEDGDDAHGAE
jgi:hypothetical protein